MQKRVLCSKFSPVTILVDSSRRKAKSGVIKFKSKVILNKRNQKKTKSSRERDLRE